jgi:hypothetical protein
MNKFIELNIHKFFRCQKRMWLFCCHASASAPSSVLLFCGIEGSWNWHQFNSSPTNFAYSKMLVSFACVETAGKHFSSIFFYLLQATKKGGSWKDLVGC